MWQSLSFGSKYKSAYCQAVCPAGDDVIGPYLADKAAWRRDIALPLMRKEENVYVTSGTRAEHVALRNPAKRVRYVDYRPSLSSPQNFALGLKHRFDRTRATDITVAVRFVFPDQSACTATIKNNALQLDDEPATDSADAVVELIGTSYNRILHPDHDPLDTEAECFRLIGDPAALGAVLMCLS
jgi:alkyl sulfatase BDS1-like metallo-beta-lactamase superfamily hydrolase